MCARSTDITNVVKFSFLSLSLLPPFLDYCYYFLLVTIITTTTTTLWTLLFKIENRVSKNWRREYCGPHMHICIHFPRTIGNARHGYWLCYKSCGHKILDGLFFSIFPLTKWYFGCLIFIFMFTSILRTFPIFSIFRYNFLFPLYCLIIYLIF